MVTVGAQNFEARFRCKKNAICIPHPLSKVGVWTALTWHLMQFCLEQQMSGETIMADCATAMDC